MEDPPLRSRRARTGGQCTGTGWHSLLHGGGSRGAGVHDSDVMGAEGEKRWRGTHTRSLNFSLKKGSRRERGMLMYHGWLMKWRPLNRPGNASCVVGTKRYVYCVCYVFSSRQVEVNLHHPISHLHSSLEIS